MSDDFESAFDDLDDETLSQIIEQAEKQHQQQARQPIAKSIHNPPTTTTTTVLRERLTPSKRQRIEANVQSKALQKPVVDPNPFARPRPTVASVSINAPVAPLSQRQPGHDALRAWGQTSVARNAVAVPPPPAAKRSEQDIASRKNEALQRQLDKVRSEFEALRREADARLETAQTKTGEATTLRNKLDQIRDELDKERREARAREAALQAQIEAQQNTHKHQLEAMKVETAFKKNDIEASRARLTTTAAGWKQRGASITPGKHASPTRQPMRQMTGFSNAFAPPPVPAPAPGSTRHAAPSSASRRDLKGTKTAPAMSARSTPPPDPKGKGKERDEDDVRLNEAMHVDPVDTATTPLMLPLDVRLLIVEELLNHLSLRRSEDSSTKSAPEWISTVLYLTSATLPASCPTTTRNDYDSACRRLFTSLSSIGPAVGVSDASTLETACDVASTIEELLRVFIALTCVGPLIATLSLAAHLASRFDEVAVFQLNAVPDRPSRLLLSLAQILRRFCRPPATASSAQSHSGKSSEQAKATQRRRSTRSSDAHDSNAGGKRRTPAADEVTLDEQSRIALLDAVLYCLCALATRHDEAIGVEPAFSEFLASQDAVAILLDPLQPKRVLTTSIDLLAQLACRPRLFRALTGTKFYPASDFTDQQLPLIKRVGFLLFEDLKKKQQKQPTSAHGPDGNDGDDDEDLSHELRMAILSLTAVLALQHEDALTFITSGYIMTEFINLIAADVHTVWDFASPVLSSTSLRVLSSTVDRLSATVQLVHYLLLNPHSTIEINNMLTTRMRFGAYERYTVAFGTLMLAGLPAWVDAVASNPIAKNDARHDGESEQRRLKSTLAKLSHLASDLLEEQTIEEDETMMACFGVSPPAESQDGIDEAMDDADDEEALRQVPFAEDDAL